MSLLEKLFDLLKDNAGAANRFAKTLAMIAFGLEHLAHLYDNGPTWIDLGKTQVHLRSFYAPTLTLIWTVVCATGVGWKLWQGQRIAPVIGFISLGGGFMLPLLPALSKNTKMIGYKLGLMVIGIVVIGFGAYGEVVRQLRDIHAIRHLGHDVPGELYGSLGIPIGMFLMLIPCLVVAVIGTKGHIRLGTVPAWVALTIGFGSTALIDGRLAPALSAGFCFYAAIAASSRRRHFDASINHAQPSPPNWPHATPLD